MKTLALWAFGLFASGAFGTMIGWALAPGQVSILLGAAGGMATFACARLWRV